MAVSPANLTRPSGHVRCQAPSQNCNARSPGSPADGIELAPVALELLAFLRDDVGRRVGDEALVREHLLAARHLAAEPLALRLDVAVLALRRPVGLDDRVEDPLLVAV